jgi:hypothetical protein
VLTTLTTKGTRSGVGGDSFYFVRRWRVYLFVCLIYSDFFLLLAWMILIAFPMRVSYGFVSNGSQSSHDASAGLPAARRPDPHEAASVLPQRRGAD